MTVTEDPPAPMGQDIPNDDNDADDNGPDLPNADHPTIHKSHEGEHHGDYGQVEVKITKQCYLYVFCAALNSCNLGYDIGVNTTAGPLIQDTFDLSDVQLEILLGSLNFWAMIGALGASYISDTFGRRKSFVFAAIGFIIGVILMCVAQGYGLLMFGRVFVGLGIGFGLAIDPLYISEISPASHRGYLVTWSENAINIGIVLGFISGLIFDGVEESKAWRFMIALGVILPCVMIYLASNVMPESPRWLISKQRKEEAQEILEKVYPNGYDVQPIITDIADSIEREQIAEQAVGWDVIFHPTPAFRRMLWVGVGTAIAQQAVGIDAVQYFLVKILRETGIESRTKQSLVLIFLGLVKLIFVIIAGKLFDKRGRRPLFFISLSGMILALLMLAINFLSDEYNKGFSVFGLSLYLAFFSLGMGPGAWLIPSEVFSTCIRAKAMSVATFLNRATATLMSSTALSTANAMSWAGFFFLLAGICFIVFAFLYFYLPETKSRSLEDMAVYFAEITNDTSVLDAEEKILREREARGTATVEMTSSSQPQSYVSPDALAPDDTKGEMA